MTNRDMLRTEAERLLELEESAQGTELFRTPGDELQVAKAMDQAEASGWIPEREVEGAVSAGSCAHRDALRQAMDRIEEAAAGPASAPGWREEVKDALIELRDALAVHTSATESVDGFLDEVAGREPRLSREVDEIRAEHREMRDQIEATLTYVGGQAEALAVRRRLLRELARMAVHRQRGSDLLYEAYSVDLGRGD